MATFNEELARIQGQDFLGGLVQAASSKLMTARLEGTQKTITDLNEQLSKIDDVPLSTDEQLDRLTTSGEGREAIESLEDTAANYKAFQEKIAKRRAMYGTAYTEAINKLGMIGGDQAEQARQVITQERLMKFRELESQGEIPEEALKYAETVANFTMTKEKLQDFYDARKANEQLNEVQDFIISSDIFQAIDSYNEKVYIDTQTGKSRINQFSSKVATLTAEVRSQYPNLEPGVVNAAIGEALSLYGKSIQGQQLTPNQWQNARRNDPLALGQSKADISTSLNFMSDFSMRWMNLSNNVKNYLVQRYRGQAGSLTQDILAEQNLTKDDLEALSVDLENFLDLSTQMGMIFGENWSNPDKFIDPDTGLPSPVLLEDETNNPVFSFPRVHEIIRVTNPSQFFGKGYLYDPVVWLDRQEGFRERFIEDQTRTFMESEDQPYNVFNAPRHPFGQASGAVGAGSGIFGSFIMAEFMNDFTARGEAIKTYEQRVKEAQTKTGKK